MKVTTEVIDVTSICEMAGHKKGPDGKLSLSPTQQTLDGLSAAAVEHYMDRVGGWKIGDPLCEVILTGACPVWAYLAIAHALHGRAAKLSYAAPNAPPLVIWAHGV